MQAASAGIGDADQDRLRERWPLESCWPCAGLILNCRKQDRVRLRSAAVSRGRGARARDPRAVLPAQDESWNPHHRDTAKLVSELRRWKLQCPPSVEQLVFPAPAGPPCTGKDYCGKASIQPCGGRSCARSRFTACVTVARRFDQARGCDHGPATSPRSRQSGDHAAHLRALVAR